MRTLHPSALIAPVSFLLPGALAIVMAVVVASDHPTAAWDDLSVETFFSIVGIVTIFSLVAGASLIAISNRIVGRCVVGAGLVIAVLCCVAKLWLLLGALFVPLLLTWWNSMRSNHALNTDAERPQRAG